MAGKYLLTTLGCKVNQYESQQIREALESAGLCPAGGGEAPDIAVVNTCAVTGTACRKTRQAIRRVAWGGRTPVVVVGCGVTADAEQLRRIRGVTALLGHDADICSELRRLLLHRFDGQPAETPDHSTSCNGTTHKRPDVSRYDESMKPAGAQPGYARWTSRTTVPSKDIIPRPPTVVKATGPLVARITSFAGHQRAFLKVQDGCDAFCSYCIIPRLRPWPRSKPIKVAVAEARDLVRAGHKEIVVTGIFLGAYGRETAVRRRWARQGSPLAALVDALAGVEGLRRLRLSSLEPGDVDEALLEGLSAHENCVPHLHLPLQSGSGAILRRMNRQYTVAAFVEMIERVRAALDRPAVSTDIIVGFPGETEGDFEASIDIARRVEFCKIHAFPFSPRDQTVAARWRRDFVHPSVVRDRMRRLAEVERECSFRFRRRFVGQVERVIVEESGALDGQTDEWHNVHHGRSDRYFKVHFEADEVRPGDLISVRIDRVTPARTHGRCLDASADSYPLHVTSAR